MQLLHQREYLSLLAQHFYPGETAELLDKPAPAVLLAQQADGIQADIVVDIEPLRQHLVWDHQTVRENQVARSKSLFGIIQFGRKDQKFPLFVDRGDGIQTKINFGDAERFQQVAVTSAYERRARTCVIGKKITVRNDAIAELVLGILHCEILGCRQQQALTPRGLRECRCEEGNGN